MAKVAFELVSPDRMLLSVEADMVTVPGAEGDFGVLPGHAPLISSLRPGIITVEGSDGADGSIFVAGGFAEVADDRLTVLAEEATPLGEVDRAEVERRIRQAQDDLAAAQTEDHRQQAEVNLDYLNKMMDALERAAS